MKDLIIDVDRYEISPKLPETGIYVRATLRGKWGSYDIVHLTKESLIEWLHKDGGDNKLAENCVGILLGHGCLYQ